MNAPTVAALLLTLTAACSEPTPPAKVPHFDPSSAEAALPEVLAAMRRGQPEEALRLLDARAGTALPEGAGHYRALALMDAGRSEQALAAWDEELAEHPGNARAHTFRADLLMDAGRIEAAGLALAESQRLLPGFPATSLLSGRLGLLTDDDAVAERHFTDYLNNDPYSIEAAEAHAALSQIHARRGPDSAARAHDHAEVSSYLRQVHDYRSSYRLRLVDDPNDLEAAYGLALTYLDQFQRSANPDLRLLDPAQEALQHVLARQPDHAASLGNLGTIRAYRGNFAGAREAFAAAVAADPTMTTAWIHLGALDFKSGDLPGALESYERAIAVADNDEHRGRALVELADALAASDPAAALARLEAYLELLPQDPADRLELIRTLRASVGATDSGSARGPGARDG